MNRPSTYQVILTIFVLALFLNLATFLALFLHQGALVLPLALSCLLCEAVALLLAMLDSRD